MKHILTLCLLFLAVLLYGQTGTIYGKVKLRDAEAAEYPAVTLIRTDENSLTNAVVDYQLENIVAVKCVLRVSFVGCKVVELQMKLNHGESYESNDIVLRVISNTAWKRYFRLV